MQQDFYSLADYATSLLKGSEVYTCSFSGETSDFVRLNKSAIRQPGRVTQRVMGLDLIDGQKHTAGTVTLAGNLEEDQKKTSKLIEELRQRLPHVPEDPYLLYSTDVQSSEVHGENKLPKAQDAVNAILEAGVGQDLVGIYAAGGIHRGFANSLGQKNWFSCYSFNFDWSSYLRADKAVKSAYAGFEWDRAAFDRKVSLSKEQLEVLARPERKIEPGGYRVYLTPSALQSIFEVLCWYGFGLKDCRTKQTGLLKLVEGEASLNELVTIRENTAGGIGPNFQTEGFIKPDTVDLITRGKHASCLVSPRSAKEYGEPTNGANSWEAPESIEMEPGDIPESEILKRLGTGIWISNLWYLNYSDRAAGRMTGMTRFATFWVKDGKIDAPLSVMRFDETIYRILGEKLVGLTSEPELILDPETYFARSTGSTKAPGALIDDFTFTL